MIAEAVGNRGEVGVVRAHDDGDRKLGRLERVVATGGNEAATNESNTGQRVDRSQFADGVEKDDFAGTERARCVPRSCWLACPAGTLAPKSAGFIEKGRDGAETLRMTRRKDEDKLRISGKKAWPRFNQSGFLALERAARNDDSQTGCHRSQ